ncbi:MAG: DUF3298 domain-containing protein [Paludibacter sp.]|nr:DUF3298 domain-containing protein [Paludibacter sp.]
MKTIKILLVLLATICLLASCDFIDKSAFKFTSLEDSLVVACPQTQDTCFEMQLKMEFPTKGVDTTALKNVQRTLITDLFTEKYTDVASENLLGTYIAACHEEYNLVETDIKGSPVLYHYQEHLTAVPLYESDKLLSYEATRYLFTGGAHGLETTMCWVFDVATGNQLTEDDIFVENYSDSLVSILTRLLEADAAQRSLTLNDFWLKQLIPNGNFAIVEDGLYYQFNPYDIAPYAVGSTRLFIAKEELLPLLKKGTSVYELFTQK